MRIATVVLQQLVVMCFFGVLIYKLLKRDKNRKIYTLVFFYLLCIAFTTLNVVYLFISSNRLTFWLHFVSLYMMILSPVFYDVFNMMILKSEQVLDVRLETIIIVFYSSLLFLGMFIFGYIFQGIKIDESTSWRPVWSPSFVLQMYALITCICLIPNIVRTRQIFRTIKNEELRKRWKFLSIGFFILLGVGYGVFIHNAWDNVVFKSIWFIISFISLPAILMIHYGFRSME